MTRSALHPSLRRAALTFGALLSLVALAVPASASASASASAPAVAKSRSAQAAYQCTRTSTTNVYDIRQFTTGETVCVNGYQFIDQADGNFVIYSPTGQALWSTRTAIGKPTNVLLQDDNNFVVYDGTRALFATNTAGIYGSYLCLQTDGNMVIYFSVGYLTCTGKVMWASGT